MIVSGEGFWCFTSSSFNKSQCFNDQSENSGEPYHWSLQGGIYLKQWESFGCWGPTDDPCCDHQWLITLSGHQSRNALTGALSWCWALPKLRLGLSPEGQWMGNSWLLSNPHPNYSSHLLFILSIWLSICFWCRQWLYTWYSSSFTCILQKH